MKKGDFRRKYPISKCSKSNQMPLTDRITEISPFLRNFSELPSKLSTMLFSVWTDQQRHHEDNQDQEQGHQELSQVEHYFCIYHDTHFREVGSTECDAHQ